MSIKDLAQTVILICSFLMIPVFGFSYFMYSQLGLDQGDVLDKAFSITSSVFGGVATLTAAYIASTLYIDWRKPHTANLYTEYAKRIIESFFQILSHQQDLMIKQSQLKGLIFHKNAERKRNPNTLSAQEISKLQGLNIETLHIINNIYSELKLIYKNANTLAALTNDVSILAIDINLRQHLYGLYRNIREQECLNQPYYIYNQLVVITEDRFLHLTRDSTIKKLKEIGRLE